MSPIPVPDDFSPAVAPEEAFDALYGLELLDLDGDGDGGGDGGGSDGAMRGRVLIRDELRQPGGLLHGGVIAAAAESLASWGTWRGAGGEVTAVMGMSNDTNFLRPFLDGYVNATATPVHRGRTRWLWEVQARDDQGRLCAVTMVNIAIRTRPPGA